MPATRAANKSLSALWVLYETQGDTRAPSIVVNAYKRFDGNILVTARRLGIKRQTIYRWMDKYPDFKIAMDRARYEIEERLRTTRGIEGT